MSEIFEEKIPDFQDRQNFWNEISVNSIEVKDEAIDELLKEFRSMYSNGKVIFKCFEFSAHPVFEWYSVRGNLFGLLFLTKFFLLPQVKNELLELKIKEVDFSPKVFNEIGNALCLDGRLARQLVWGGAYNNFNGNYKNAKDLANRFCFALFKNRYEDVDFFVTTQAWTEWFYDVVWDSTWLILDKKEHRLWCLFMTDTD